MQREAIDQPRDRQKFVDGTRGLAKKVQQIIPSSCVAVVACCNFEPTDGTSSWQNAASFDNIQSLSEFSVPSTD